MGAKINAQNKFGNTALMKAVDNGHHHIVRLLCKRCSDLNINAVNEAGDTALLIALRHGYCKDAEFLVEQGSELNTRNALGEFPLALACKNGSLKIIRKILVQNHLDAEGDSWETKSSGRAAVDPLMMAVKYNRTPGVVQLLLQKTKIRLTQKHIAHILKRPDASLLLQEILGITKLVNKTDENKIDPYPTNALQEILIGAITKNDTMRIRSLLSKYDGIDLNAVFHSSTFTPLIQAIKSESDAALKCLLRMGFQPNNENSGDGETALHIACRKDMGAAVKLLIKYGADVNCRNHDGDTPLIVAATHGSLKATEALTGAFGVEYNASNNKNVTALETSIKLRNQKVCEKLMVHDELTRYGYRSMKESLEVDIKDRDIKILELTRANLQLKIEKKEALDKANKQCELVSNAAKGILEIANFFLIQKKRLRADDSKMFLEKVKGIDTSSKASRKTKKERLQMISKMLEQLSDQLDVKF